MLKSILVLCAEIMSIIALCFYVYHVDRFENKNGNSLSMGQFFQNSKCFLGTCLLLYTMSISGHPKRPNA